MGSMIGGISGMAMNTVGTIFGAVAGMKADKKLSKLLNENPSYTQSPYAKERYDLAKTLLNSRMAGSATMERGIQSAAGNAYGNIQRNTTDSSQALAMMAGIQGQAGDQSTNLGRLEGQDYQQKLANLSGAQEGMTTEHKDMFDDTLRRWQDRVNVTMAQNALRQQGAKNINSYGDSMNSSLTSMGSGMGASQGGGMSAGGGIGSDKRIKHNYHIVGKSPSGINIWEFSYLGSNDRYVGVMADEIEKCQPDAVIYNNGFMSVDYNKIDVEFKKV